jgi:hypothetical protein
MIRSTTSGSRCLQLSAAAPSTGMASDIGSGVDQRPSVVVMLFTGTINPTPPTTDAEARRLREEREILTGSSPASKA